MSEIRLKEYLEENSLKLKLNKKGFLDNFFGKTGGSLFVDEFVEKRLKGRHTWEIRLKSSSQENPKTRINLDYNQDVKFRLDSASKETQDPKIELSLIRRSKPNGSGAVPTVATLSGDISLLLPKSELIFIGQAKKTGQKTYQLREESVDKFTRPAIPLQAAQLIIDDVRNSIRITPNLDMQGRVYRIGSKGVIVSFDSLSVTGQKQVAQLTFNGGHLWQTK